MPRRNRNAQPVYRPKEPWIDLSSFDGREEMRSYLKTTGESIVREHRESLREVKPERTFQPYRVLPQPAPSPLWSFLKRFNWPLMMDYLLVGLLALAIAAITGVMVFAPGRP